MKDHIAGLAAVPCRPSATSSMTIVIELRSMYLVGTLSRFSWSSRRWYPRCNRNRLSAPVAPYSHKQPTTLYHHAKVNAYPGPTYPIGYLASLYLLPIIRL